MKKQLKKFVTIVSFQIGVNIIGLPIFHEIAFYRTPKLTTSKFF